MRDVKGAKAAEITCLVLLAGLGLAATIAPACAGDDEDDPLGTTWTDRISNTIKDKVNSASAAVGLSKPPGPPPAEAPSGCPTITVLAGTESQRVMAAGATGNQGLRYQYSLGAVARECSVSGNRVSIKVGAGGRVLLGPAGAAGRFDVPIRVVVYSEAQGKPVESKLYKVPASIGAGQAATPFQFVSDTLVVSMASGARATDYSIKVGIDGGGKGGDATAAVHKKSRHAKAPAATEAAAQ